MSTIETIVNEFCKIWVDKEENFEDFKNETINMLAEVQKQLVITSIRNEVCGVSLHSDIDSVMKEFKDIKKSLSKMINVDTLEITKKELAEQFKSTNKKVNDLGPFSSKAAKDFAEENKINADSIVGTSKNGKITKTDISKYMKKSISKKSGKQEISNKYCHGTTNNGDVCKSIGKINIRGEWYCNRHKTQGERCSNLEKNDKFSDYESDKNVIESFKKSSIQSLETAEDEDKTNEIFENTSDIESDSDSDSNSDYE